MANLEVNYCGVKYRNPLVLASASPGWDGEAMRIAAEHGIGGVIPKTIGPKQDWAAHPRNGRFYLHKSNGKPIGQVNLELFTTMTRDEWIRHDLAVAKSGGATMHISILAMPDVNDTASLVEEMQDTGMVDLFELNVSCPMPAATVVDANLSKIGFLLVVNILMIIEGMFIDGSSAIIITAPLLYNAAISLGIDPIHLGVIMVANAAIGMFTPPFGLNLFVAQPVTGNDMKTIMKGVLPFVAISIAALFIITYIPQISMFLPNLIYK